MRPINSGKPCWIDPFSENVEVKVDYKQAIATYCAPITHSDGQILGVVTADISFNGMADVLNAEEPPLEITPIMLTSCGKKCRRMATAW